MQIRSIASHELRQLLELYKHLHPSDDPLPEPSVVKATWEELIGSPRHRYFGAFLLDELVSTCTSTIIPNLTRGCRPYGIIENVVTHPLYRKKGIGSRVLEHALVFAWSQKCYKVMLMTGRKDEATHRFYEKVGFDRLSKQAFIARPPAS